MAKQRGISAQPDEKHEDFSKGNNYFLGIGINDYTSFSKLFNARKDVEDIFKTLSSAYNFETAHAEILTDATATRNNILKKLKELRTKVQRDDRLLIYYSGHGYNEEELGYWIPVDAEKGEIGDYISNSEVRELIKTIHAKHILLISDSCFSASLLVRDASRDTGGAFEDWDRNDSRWVFISGKGVVSDGKQGENSPFAKAIIKQLQDVKDEAVNIARLADNVISSVRFNYEQQAEISPLFGAGHEGGQFIFRKVESEYSKEEKAWKNAINQDNALTYFDFIERFPNSLYKEEAFEKMRAAEDRNDWNAAKRLGGLSDFMGYLQKRPNGNFVEVAKAEIDKIRNAATQQKEVEKVIMKTNTPTERKKIEKPQEPKTIAAPPATQNESSATPTIMYWGKRVAIGIAALLVIFYIIGIMNPEVPPNPINSTVTVTDTGNNPIDQNATIGTTPKTEAPKNDTTKPNNNNGGLTKLDRYKGVVKINLEEYNAYQRALTKNTPESYQEYLNQYPNTDPNRALIAAQKRDFLRSKLSATTLIKSNVRTQAYVNEITEIEKLIYEDYEYKKAVIRLEKMASTYPNDEKVIKLIKVCKEHL